MELDPESRPLTKLHLHWISRQFVYRMSMSLFLEIDCKMVDMNIASKVIYKFILFTSVLEELQFLRFDSYLDVRDAGKLESTLTELGFIQRLVSLNLVWFTITLCRVTTRVLRIRPVCCSQPI